LQPILIRPLEHGFEIVAGHRRFQACRTLRWRFIPSKIRELSDKQAYEIQLTENIQRKSMDPIEEAEAFRRYVIDFGWGGVSELARKICKSEEYVSHHMQLLKLPDEIKHKIMNNSLNVSQAI
jgi:ParB family chromosome partitioning protein